QFLLPRVHRADDGPDPPQLEPDGGSIRPDDHQVHDSTRRPHHRAGAGEIERLYGPGSQRAARGDDHAAAAAIAGGVLQPDADGSPQFSVSTMRQTPLTTLLTAGFRFCARQVPMAAVAVAVAATAGLVVPGARSQAHQP